MRSKRQLLTKQGRGRSRLYVFVFAGKISVLTVLFLFLSFLFQPFHQVMANEVEGEPETVVVSEVQPQEPEGEEVVEPVEEEDETTDSAESAEHDSVEEVELKTLPPESDVDTAVTETEYDAEETATSTESATPPVDDEANEDADFAGAANESETATTTDSGPTSSSTVDTTGTGAATTTVSTTTSSSGSSGDPDIDSAPSGGSGSDDETDVVEESESLTETDDGSEGGADADSAAEETEELEDATASDDDKTISTDSTEIVNTTQSSDTTVVQAQQLITEDNYYQFSRQSCVPVGDGTYHCSLSTEPVIDSQTAVYADRDADGDMEIFIRTAKGNIEQITENDLDDTSPHLDVVSMRIVWQRMIDGRYQIIEYDLDERKETQLTFSRTNNMEPKASDDGIVWQAWDGNDWEIMYFDGKYTDQITDNSNQDVAPVIEDGYILWSILGSEKQEARVYSLESGEVMTISGHEGGEIANPRFVLVYDTRFDNGDVVTQGFDPATGLSQPIAAKPAPEPIDIPDVDPIGEIRALIQNKSTQKENGVKTTVDSGSNNGVGSIPTTTDTLNLHEFADDLTGLDIEADASAPSTTEDLVLDDFDLVITPTATSTSMPEYATIDRAVIEAANASTSSSTRRSI